MVLAGWITSVLASAHIGEVAREPHRFDEFATGTATTFDPKLTIEPAPFGNSCCASAYRVRFQRWVQDPVDRGIFAQKASTAAVFSMWRSIRSASVSTPCSK